MWPAGGGAAGLVGTSRDAHRQARVPIWACHQTVCGAARDGRRAWVTLGQITRLSIFSWEHGFYSVGCGITAERFWAMKHTENNDILQPSSLPRVLVPRLLPGLGLCLLCLPIRSQVSAGPGSGAQRGCLAETEAGLCWGSQHSSPFRAGSEFRPV